MDKRDKGMRNESGRGKEREGASVLRADGVELRGFQCAELLSLSKRPI